LQDAFGKVQTNIDWLAPDDLRNSTDVVERANYEAKA
jgi:hypothetical protein